MSPVYLDDPDLPAKMREWSSDAPHRFTNEACHMLADAIEIADSCARADIECNCANVSIVGEGGSWYDSTSLEDTNDTDAIVQALRYLDARGLVERHPQHGHLVRFPKVTP